MTRNPEIPIAKSLTDYIFRWMAMEFVPGYRAAHAPKREKKKPAAAPAPEPQPESDMGDLPLTNEPAAGNHAPAQKKEGNGHGPRMDLDSAKPFSYSES